jgi:O-antigen/teichoic acid export membrane protein
LRSDFAKNAAWVSGGTAISQGITVIASIAITRIYTDEDFGVFTLYVAILSVLLIASSLKLEHAIPITTSTGATLNLVALNFIILIVFSALLFLFLLFFGPHLSNWLAAPNSNNYFLLIPLGLLFGGTYNILYQWALKLKIFKLITRTKIAQGTGLSIGKIGIGVVHASPFGLISGHIIGKSAGVFSLSRRFLKTYKGKFGLVSGKRMNWGLVRFKQFPLLTLPAQLLSAGGQRLPIFIITVFYGLDIVGQFGLCEMIISLPVVLIGTAVGDVFYAEVAEKGKREPQKILHLSDQLVKKLSLIGLAPMVILLLFGPYLFAFVFGEDWRTAGEIAQVLGILAFFRLVFTPLSRVYILYEKHLALLIFNALRIAIILLCFGVANYLEFTYMQAILVYTVGMSLVYFFIYLYARTIIKNQIRLGTK